MITQIILQPWKIQAGHASDGVRDVDEDDDDVDEADDDIDDDVDEQHTATRKSSRVSK